MLKTQVAAQTFSFARYMNDYVGVLNRLDDAVLERMAHMVFGAWQKNRTVFCCGNGGSSANACHFMADLTKLTAPARGNRLRAMALTESLSAISAIANDISYDEIFVEQLKPFLAQDDVVIGLSTSGSSANVIRAIGYANASGAVTLGITGRQGFQLQGIAQETLVLQSTSVQHIEDATMVASHVLCLRVKDLIARDRQEATFKESAVLLPGLRSAAV